MGNGVLTNSRGIEDLGSAGGLADHVHQHWFVLKVWEGLRKGRGEGKMKEREDPITLYNMLHTCTHTHTHARTHAHTHAHAHTHTLTHSLTSLP